MLLPPLLIKSYLSWLILKMFYQIRLLFLNILKLENKLQGVVYLMVSFMEISQLIYHQPKRALLIILPSIIS